MPPILNPIQFDSGTMTDRVFEALRDAITKKTLAPGQRISEAKLAQDLNVSKTPVREALIRLRQVGLVEVRGNGMRVIQPSASDLRDVFEYRSALEQACVRLAAERADDSAVERIVDRAAASLIAAKTHDPSGFRSADHQFHMAIAESTGNIKLHAALRDAIMLASVLRMRGIPSGETPRSSTSCAQQHTLIGEAIRSRDSRAAAELMGQHIDHVYEIVSEIPTDPH